MQSAILAKLQQKLAGPPEDEADVVYVLVEIRKYLDHVNPKGGQYAVLRTYCDWPVHIFLDRSGAKSLLRSLDDAFATKRTEAERNKAMRTAFDQFSLTQFRNELRLFLQSENLPLTLVDDHTYWGQFLKHYVAVVSDCAFVFRRRPTHRRAIRKATLEINEQTQSLEKSMEGMVNVIWVWRLEFADGTTRRISNTYGYRTKSGGDNVVTEPQQAPNPHDDITEIMHCNRPATHLYRQGPTGRSAWRLTRASGTCGKTFSVGLYREHVILVCERCLTSEHLPILVDFDLKRPGPHNPGLHTVSTTVSKIL